MVDVKLRKIRNSDARDLQESMNSKEVIKWLNDCSYPYKLSDSKDYIKKSLANKNSYEFAILVDGDFAGTIVLENPNQGKKSYEVGYFVAKKYWGRGVATKALKEICKFGFNKLELKRIWGGCVSDNKASLKVLEKSGFKLEGKTKCSTYKNGKYYDEVIYGKVRK